jgi:hypothetical protein
MTDLLIRSLCELLPHKTICKDCETDFVGVLGQVDVGFGLVGIKGTNTLNAGNILYCKPYLFPLSSMTKEQKIERQMIKHLCSNDNSFVLFDWYNKNHFDYRGLIPKGLAIDATNNNPYK